MSEAERAFKAWWQGVCAANMQEWQSSQRSFLAGHASRDSEVAELKEQLRVCEELASGPNLET